MKKPHLLIGTNAALLVLALLMLGQSLLVAQRAAHSGEIRGQVEIVRAGQQERAAIQPGVALGAGDTVYTGKNSTAEFRWPDGTRWKLMPGSALTVQDSAFHALHQSQDVKLKLTSGKVLVRVPRHLGEKDQFVVSTPHFNASVRGTVFAVESDHCRSWVKVLSGAVEVRELASSSPAPAAVKVAAGQQFRSTAYGDKTQISPLSGDDFQGQSGITTPAVEARIVAKDGGQAVLQIQTESGDRVRVNGKDLTSGREGLWEMPVQLMNGSNSWLVEATDIHGKTVRCTTEWQGALPPSAS